MLLCVRGRGGGTARQRQRQNWTGDRGGPTCKTCLYHSSWCPNGNQRQPEYSQFCLHIAPACLPSCETRCLGEVWAVDHHAFLVTVPVQCKHVLVCPRCTFVWLIFAALAHRRVGGPSPAEASIPPAQNQSVRTPDPLAGCAWNEYIFQVHECKEKPGMISGGSMSGESRLCFSPRALLLRNG